MFDQKEKTALTLEARLGELLAEGCNKKIDVIDMIVDIGKGNGLLRQLMQADRQINACRALLAKCAAGDEFTVDDVELVQLASCVQQSDVDEFEG